MAHRTPTISTFPIRFLDGAQPSATVRHAMTISKPSRHLALPDIDPSIALAPAAPPAPVEPLIARAKSERARFTAALLRRFVVRLTSSFQRVRTKRSNADVIVFKTAEERR